MARFKLVKFWARNEAGHEERLDVEILISANGNFYAYLPEQFRDAVHSRYVGFSARAPEGKFQVSALSFADLERGIQDALHAYVRPEVTEEPVIVYNIESHVSFAEDDAGRIFPNATFPGAHWVGMDRDERAKYGGHDQVNSAKGGYSLVIGAKAMLKRTTCFGARSTVKYELYYKNGDHLGHDNPAQLLNSWASFHIDVRRRETREIPYSDEAAMFFHSLMCGMAELSRRIQDATFTSERLMALIASRPTAPTLGFSAPGASL